MTALSFLILFTLSPYLASSSSLYTAKHQNVGNCINNQVRYIPVCEIPKIVKLMILNKVELADGEDIHFVAIGDWGSGKTSQEEVVFSSFRRIFLHFSSCISTFFCRLLLPSESFASWIDVTLSSQQVTHRIALYFSNVWVVWLVDFVISSGDNFYHDGVESPVDEKFDTRWKDMYSHPSIAQLPWWDARVFDIR